MRSSSAYQFGTINERPLHGHHTLHVLRNLDILHFEQFDRNSPRAGILQDIPFQQRIDLVALFQHFVEIVLSNDVSQAGQRHLLHSGAEVLDGEDSLVGVGDPKPENRVYLNGLRCPV